MPLSKATKVETHRARLARRVRELEREIARLSEELNRREAETALLKIQSFFELNFSDLGRMFGVSRQAVSAWPDRGVPPAQKPKLFTVLNIAELLERKLKPGRLPAVVRRTATSYGGLSVLRMIEADRHEELLENIRESFNWAATA